MSSSVFSIYAIDFFFLIFRYDTSSTPFKNIGSRLNGCREVYIFTTSIWSWNQIPKIVHCARCISLSHTYSFASLIYSQKIIGRLAPKDQQEFRVVYISSSFWLLDHVTYLKLRKKKCLQSRSNLQNDNYFHSKWS